MVMTVKKTRDEVPREVLVEHVTDGDDGEENKRWGATGGLGGACRGTYKCRTISDQQEQEPNPITCNMWQVIRRQWAFLPVWVSLVYPSDKLLPGKVPHNIVDCYMSYRRPTKQHFEGIKSQLWIHTHSKVCIIIPCLELFQHQTHCDSQLSSQEQTSSSVHVRVEWQYLNQLAFIVFAICLCTLQLNILLTSGQYYYYKSHDRHWGKNYKGWEGSVSMKAWIME